MMERIRLGAISVAAPEPWSNVRDDLPEGSPLTLARGREGCGALQFSLALYRAGSDPHVTVGDLSELLAGFADRNGLGQATQQSSLDGPVRYAAATFRLGEDSVRVWYCSDGRNVALVTYVAGSDEPGLRREVSEADMILRSLSFARDGDGSKV